MRKSLFCLCLILIIFATAACDSGSGTQTGETGSQTGATTAQTEESGSQTKRPDSEPYETKTVGGVKISLIAVDESLGSQYFTPAAGKVFVLCEFDVENTTKEIVMLSTVMSFTTIFDQAEEPETISIKAISSDDRKQLDYTLKAGEIFNGIIGYEVDASWKKVKIAFRPDLLSNDSAVFEYTK